ncbi:MAG TPA: glycosyltransferase [Allosphingosinicella sp.]|jgi:glycosyltransferase involved in cell wall biosynthesis
MLILHIMPDLNPGGAELMMKRLIESHLDDPRFEHRVISLRELRAVGPALQAQGVQVEALGLTSTARLPGTLWRLARRIRAARPDIVQTWMYHSDLFGGLAARMVGCRRILWGVRVADIAEIGVPRPTFWIRSACARLSSRLPSKIVYVAESARRIHERLGYDPSKSIVIPNGYRMPPEAPADRGSAAIRRELGLGASELLIGSAGRFSVQKDFRSFIQACAKIAAELPRARFLIAGREIDDSNVELGRWIAESGFAERFHLLGERRDLDSCLAGLDLFCLHSLQEGLPNVVAEAMAVGIPCVVTDVGDAAALVDDTGIVVPPADPDALATALLAMLRKPEVELRALGARARARIAEHFSMGAVRGRWEQLYNELVRRDPSPDAAPAGAGGRGGDGPAPERKH